MVALTPEGVLYGNPPRSAHAPARDDFLAWMRATESLAGSGSLTSFNETLAVLQARPAVADGKFALVISDAEEAGVYERVAGDWQKVAGLPAIFTESLAAVRAEAARDLAQTYAAAANASRQEAAEIVGFDPTLYLLKAGGSIDYLNVGQGAAAAARIEVGIGRTAEGPACVDLIGDMIYTDYGLRLIRSSGQNAESQLLHRGAGILRLQSQDGGDVRISVGAAQFAFSLSRMTVGTDLDVSGRILADRAEGAWLATQAEGQAGTSNDQVMTPLRTKQAIDALSFGATHTWSDMAGSRTAGTVYQNTTNRPIGVAVSLIDAFAASLQVSSNGVDFISLSSGHTGLDLPSFAVVPPGGYYRVTVGFFTWTELS